MRKLILFNFLWIVIMIFTSGCCTLSRTFTPNNLPSTCREPVAAFSVDRTKIMEGERVTFSNQSTGEDARSLRWSFTNGNPRESGEQNPVVTYTNPGKHPVSLMVQNGNGEDTERKPEYITVLKKLNADFDASTRTIQVGESISFQDRSLGDEIISWEWTFYGTSNERRTGSQHRITYNTAGTYRVTLKVTNSLGQSDSESKNAFIKVEGPRSLSITPNAITRICPRHTRGDTDFDGHGPRVHAWAKLRVENNKEIFVDYFLKAAETRDDWTTAEGRWSRLLWTVPAGTSIVRINSDERSEATYTDTDHELDIPRINGGDLVEKFEIRGDTGNGDVGHCTTDDVYMNIYFNPISVLIRNN